MEFFKILLVDDDEEDRAIVKDMLEMSNDEHIISFAVNGEEALRLLDNHFRLHSIIPSLIVLDLNMPKMNGTETLRNIKNDERFKNIPVIIYSTSINPLEKEKCMKLGAHSYITKPISYQEGLETARIFLQFCNEDSYSHKK